MLGGSCGMQSLRLDVTDPQTHETVPLIAYLRGDRVIFQRLGSHLFREGLTPARRAAMERFGAVARTAFGQRFTGALPPAAERVRAGFTGSRSPAPHPARRTIRQDNQAYYRALVGERKLQEIEELLRMLTDGGGAGKGGRAR